MLFKKMGIISYGLLVFLIIFNSSGEAKGSERLHPMNRKLIKMGIMPYPKYYPEIPRIRAELAYGLYLTGKALFVLISYSNHHLIMGGLHLTEDKPGEIDPNRLPFKRGQVLVIY